MACHVPVSFYLSASVNTPLRIESQLLARSNKVFCAAIVRRDGPIWIWSGVPNVSVDKNVTFGYSMHSPTKN